MNPYDGGGGRSKARARLWSGPSLSCAGARGASRVGVLYHASGGGTSAGQLSSMRGRKDLPARPGPARARAIHDHHHRDNNHRQHRTDPHNRRQLCGLSPLPAATSLMPLQSLPPTNPLRPRRHPHSLAREVRVHDDALGERGKLGKDVHASHLRALI